MQPTRPRQRHRYLQPAEDVRALRFSLQLTQAQFAARLGVSKRTVIRGEQRGLELPWTEYGPRGNVWIAWKAMQLEAADRAAAGRSVKSHPAPDLEASDTLSRIAAKVSPPAARGDAHLQVDAFAAAKRPPRRKKPKPRAPKKRLRLSRELIKARGGKNAGRTRGER